VPPLSGETRITERGARIRTTRLTRPPAWDIVRYNFGDDTEDSDGLHAVIDGWYVERADAQAVFDLWRATHPKSFYGSHPIGPDNRADFSPQKNTGLRANGPPRGGRNLLSWCLRFKESDTLSVARFMAQDG
jgi:hypothetical protein